MTEATKKMIGRLNWLILAVVSVLVLIAASGIAMLFSTHPGDVRDFAEKQFQNIDNRIESLEEKLEVRPADVLREVQELRNEMKSMKEGLPADATNDT